MAFMNDDCAPVVHGSAYRRRMRRLRSSWRHEQVSLRIQAATMGHHSLHRVSTVGTQTPAQGSNINVSVSQNFQETVEMARFASHERVQQHTVEHVPQNFPQTVETMRLAVHTLAVPVIEHVMSSPVIEFIAPTPPVTFATPNQQFPAYTMAGVTSGVSLDTTGFVHLPCPITVVETSASHVVGAPVHQERFPEQTVEQIVDVPVPFSCATGRGRELRGYAAAGVALGLCCCPGSDASFCCQPGSTYRRA